MLPQNAASLIPQKAPFVMVDLLLFADETTARTGFEIKADNVFTIDGYFQEGGLLENIAQTAATHAGYNAGLANKPVKPGFIGSVKDFEIMELPAVGDQLLTEVIIENQFFNVTVVTGSISCNGNILARCEMKVFMQDDAQ